MLGGHTGVAREREGKRTVSGKYKSDLIWLAAFLLCRGHKVLSTEDGNTRTRCSFVCNDSPRVRSEVEEYFKNGQVPVRDFSARILQLRREIDGWKETKQLHH